MNMKRTQPCEECGLLVEPGSLDDRRTEVYCSLCRETLGLDTLPSDETRKKMTPTSNNNDEFRLIPESYDVASTEINKLILAVRELRSELRRMQKWLAGVSSMVTEINEEQRKARIWWREEKGL